MNMDQLKEFVCLETRKRELDSELKAIAVRIDDLEQALVPQFLADGVASMKVDGRTVYIAQDIQASPLNDRAEVRVAVWCGMQRSLRRWQRESWPAPDSTFWKTNPRGWRSCCVFPT